MSDFDIQPEHLLIMYFPATTPPVATPATGVFSRVLYVGMPVRGLIGPTNETTRMLFQMRMRKPQSRGLL